MESPSTPVKLDVRLHLRYQIRIKWNQVQDFILPIDEADPATFLDGTLARNGAVCCSMTGAYAILVDGQNWPQAYEREPDEAFDLRQLPWNALEQAMVWIHVMAEMLAGNRKATIGPHDDEPALLLSCDRHRYISAEEDDFKDDLSVPMHALAEGLLQEGIKAQRFFTDVLQLMETRLQADDLDPKVKKALEAKRAHILSWKLGDGIRLLRSALDSTSDTLTWGNAWENVQELFTAYSPAMRQVTLLDEPRGGSMLHIEWKDLPTEEWCFLESFANHPDVARPFIWQNPFQRHPKQHLFESLEVHGPQVLLRLWVKPSGSRKGN